MVRFVGDVEFETCGSLCWQHGVANAVACSWAMVVMQLFSVFLRVSTDDLQIRGCSDVLLAVQSSWFEGPCSDVVNICIHSTLACQIVHVAILWQRWSVCRGGLRRSGDVRHVIDGCFMCGVLRSC